MLFPEILYPRSISQLLCFLLLSTCFVLMLLSVACVDSSPDSTHVVQLPEEEEFKDQIDVIIGQEKYHYSEWGFIAEDLVSGNRLLSHNENRMFAPGSTAKVFTVSSALEILGSDYHFKTPIYYEGDILVLVASGDMAMGGRGGLDGKLQYTTSDHVDAGAFGECILVEGDPLAGLESLAQQVSDSGLRSIRDVVIDTRLFEEMKLTAEGIITPIVINDNLIDITITPGEEGEPATIDWRPKSSAFTISHNIITTQSGSMMDVHIPDYSGQSVLELTGTIPVNSEKVNLTSNVLVPSIFARSLFIDSLEKAGVSVDASTSGNNPIQKLPAPGSYSKSDLIAELVSPPFSEYAKVTLKVSQNLYANCLLGIMAADEGFDQVDYGLYSEGLFLESIGVDLNSLLLLDGEGSIMNRISPEAAIDLVTSMSGTNESGVLKESMPIFGIDGTLHSAVEPGSPGYGEIYAKTGTSVTVDMTGNLFVYARGLLGYMKTKNGHDIAFVIYVNNVPGIRDMDGIQDVIGDVNDLAVLMYENL